MEHSNDITTKRKQLTEVIRFLASRGWSPGTGGNFSVVLEGNPLKVLMSPSGIDKGLVTEDQLIIVDNVGSIHKDFPTHYKTSAETLIHLFLCKELGAKAVLHTHSRWNTVLSRRFLSQGALHLEGFEMLKALGKTTHETFIDVPIFPNDQDISQFVELLRKNQSKLTTQPGFLMAGHGLYAWGDSLAEAKRHIEAFEFLFDVAGYELI